MITINNEMKRFNYLTSELNAAYHEAAVKLGLSDSAMQILYTVCSFGSSCLISDVCRLTGISKQTINSALRKLEQSDIIRLEASTGRNKRIILTEKGRSLSERTALKIIGIENSIFDSWSEEKKAMYLTMTQEYLDMFRTQTEQLSPTEENK